MGNAERAGLKNLIDREVRTLLGSGGRNPLSGTADRRKSTIGSTFLAELPRRTQRHSIFTAYVQYEGIEAD